MKRVVTALFRAGGNLTIVRRAAARSSVTSPSHSTPLVLEGLNKLNKVGSGCQSWAAKLQFAAPVTRQSQLRESSTGSRHSEAASVSGQFAGGTRQSPPTARRPLKVGVRA